MAALAPLLGGLATGLSAQAPVIRGAIVDSETAAPLGSARIEATAGRHVIAAYSDPRGRFTLRPGVPGPLELVVTRIGYAPRHVAWDSGAAVTIALTALAVPLDPVVVSASRSEEEAIRTPMSVSVVGREEIEARAGLVPVENVRTVTGVDLASKGLIQSTYSVRGERGAISGTMLTLSDFRYADVPSIAVNVPYLIAATDEDLDRIEVVRGPGAALYGPGADRGVLHLITRSPFESPGGTLTLTGGGRSLLEGSVRYAARLLPTLAVKLSADYVTGEDWPYTDPIEVAAREAAIAGGASADTLLIGRRESRLTRAGGELRADWRPDAATELVTTVGTSDAVSVIDLASDVGSVQGRNWRYSYAQARLRRGRFVTNLFGNFGGTGDSYLLRTGHLLVDSSRVLVAQLQHGFTRGAADVLYGADLRWTDPRTGGTVDGEHETSDRMTEIGGYVHAKLAVGRAVDLTVAVRADHHNRLDDFVVSPRLGVVVRPSPEHALRLTFNRAFTSPDATTLFADLPLGSVPRYALIRASSIPQGGYGFRRDCGGPCMYSPFAADLTAPLPIDATLLWSRLCSVVPEVCNIPAPTAAQVGTNLGVLDPASEAFVPTTASAVADIPALRRTITTSVELGWKAMLRGGYDLGVDLYANRVSNPLGSRYTATPNAFFDPTTLVAYLAGFMSAAQAAQLAAALAQLPVGTLSPRQTTHTTDLLVLSRQGGAYTLWGLDLSLAVPIGRFVTARGSYSWLSRNRVLVGAARDTFVLGVPRHKGSVELKGGSAAGGLTVAAVYRWVEGFPVHTGVYVGEVGSYDLVDARVGFRVPGLSRATLLLEGTNLLDHRHQEFVGAPAVGRLIVTRLRTEF